MFEMTKRDKWEKKNKNIIKLVIRVSRLEAGMEKQR